MMAAMMGGLLKNDLKKLLIKTYPQDFSDMLACAEKYACMEEAFADDPPASFIVTGSNKKHFPRQKKRIHQGSRFPF